MPDTDLSARDLAINKAPGAWSFHLTGGERQVIQTCTVSEVTVPQKAVTHEMHGEGQDGVLENQ